MAANTVSPTMNLRVGVGIQEDDQSVILVTWNHLNNTQWWGAPVPYSQWADRTVQFSGTFNSATVVLEGSNDGTNYKTLTDAAGTALSLTAAGLKQVTESPLFVRPNVNTNVGVATDITCSLLMRRNGRLTR
jgi:hypothetical protein